MKYLNERITPYVGLESFKLGNSLVYVRTELKSQKVAFNQTIDSNKGCTPPIPWTNICIDNSILLTFANDILFRIYVKGAYVGELPNGVCVGMDLDQLEQIDSSIFYNDEEEYYCSQNGYWINEDTKTNKVEGVAVFLPELEGDEFWNYEWTKKYK